MIDYKKRFKAYLIDLAIVFGIIFLIYLLIPRSNEIKILINSLYELNVLFTSNQISFSEYYQDLSIAVRQIDYLQIYLTLINIFLIIIYFVMYPYFTDGKTYGQRKMKIQIVNFNNEIPNVRQFMIRNLVINGLLYMFGSVLLLFIAKESSYFTMITILGIIQLLIVIISSYMVIYNSEKKGLQDILSNTFFKEEV